MKWSESTTYKFVNEYLKHECLYNSKNVNHRKKRARHAAIEKICEVMNLEDFGPREVVAKLKSIRSTYSQELKKIKDFNSEEGRYEAYVPSLKWFSLYHEAMIGKTAPRESQNNSSYAASAVEEIFVADEPNGQDPCSSNDSQYILIKQENLPKVEKHSRKRKIERSENLMQRSRAVGEIQTPVASSTPRRDHYENEFDIFGRSVAAQLSAMPLRQALKAQSHIQNFLSTLRLSVIENKTYMSPPSPTADNLDVVYEYNNDDELSEEQN